MIDFRYHVVSLVAVFLALALGVLLGTTQLSGVVSDDLRGQVRQLDAGQAPTCRRSCAPCRAGPRATTR